MNALYTLIVTYLLSFALSANGQLNNTEQQIPSTQLQADAVDGIQITTSDSKAKPIEVAAFDINSEIHGNLATTELTIKLFNPNPRNLSADFIFPIPADSVITGYALDVNGQLIDGVAVEKNKARITFEKIVRKNIDPGLIEKIQGNVFKTRIFPLSAQQHRTIQIRFFSDISFAGQTALYQVPLMAHKKVNTFSLEIKAFTEALQTGKKPKVKGKKFQQLDFIEWKGAYVAQFKKNDFTLDQSMSIELPKAINKHTIIAKNSHNEHFFSFLPSVPSKKMPKQKKIGNLELIWDASHSRASANHRLEKRSLEAFFKSQKTVKVNLHLLRNKLSTVTSFNIEDGNWSELENTLTKIAYDGATNLNALIDLAPHRSTDAIFLFTDGLHTFSEKTDIKLAAPLYVFNSDLTSNTRALDQLANSNGGQAFFLSEKTNMTQAIDQIGKERLQLSIKVIEGSVEGLPLSPVFLHLNEHSKITGKLISNEARLLLTYGYKGHKKTLSTLTLSQSDSISSELTELLWAQQQLERLQINSKENKAAIIQLSQKYNLVSDHTSLIVLESLTQYVEHNIPPPPSLAKMRASYFTQIENQQQQLKHNKQQKVEQVLAMWENRKKWWNTEFHSRKNEKAKLFNNPIAEQASEQLAVEIDEMADDLDLGLEYEPRSRQALGLTTASQRPDADKNDHGIKQGQNIGQRFQVQIEDWDPQTPYLIKLNSTAKHLQQETYYQLKLNHLSAPSFYFDCAHFFFTNEQPEMGLQVLSNIAELKIQDSRLLRTLAIKLKQQNLFRLSAETYRQVLEQRPEEPQSYRDLALVLIESTHNAGKTEKKTLYTEAIELLYQVITGQWDRFYGIEVTTLMEINQLIPMLNQHHIDHSFIDKRLIQMMPVDLRIISTWDSDLTDIDLWVIEPNGEKVYYSNNLSSSGGSFHQDFTDGYGPEEYLHKKAKKGHYQIKVHFYGNRSPELSGATTVYVEVYTNFGRANQNKQTLSLRLQNANDDYLVGTIQI